jgi:copper chaperone CopZ
LETLETKTARMIEAVYYLTNVHCADCVKSLTEDVLLKLDGVKDVRFNAQNSQLTVCYDDSVLAEEEVRKAIIETGCGIAEQPKKKASWFENILAIAVVLLAIVSFILWMKQL